LSVVAQADNLQYQAVTQIAWKAKVFYGHLSTQVDNVTLINGLQANALASSRGRTFTVNAVEGEYIYYAVPTSMSSGIVFTSGGFDGGFHLRSTGVMITNPYGVTLSYDIWESDNVNLGVTTVVVS
jgi:hypothetical protein